MNSFAVLILLTLLLADPLASQSSDSAASRQSAPPVKDDAALPPGWTARPDAEGDASDIKFKIMEPGYHLTLGPATILYREEDRVEGPFHTLATFHQTKKLRHPEGYGLFLSGQNLNRPGQAYTYFLVRGDGKFIVKRREGDKLSDLTDGWKAHPAVKRADAKGMVTNLLEIDAKRDPKRISFLVNGKEVHQLSAQQMDITGIVGIRANHNLDLHVEDFAVHK